MLRSVLAHPFLTYVLVLSMAVALGLAAWLKFRPDRRGGIDPWLYALPMGVPVVSYFINYFVLGKACGAGHAYTGRFTGFPSYHFFCALNGDTVAWIGPLSLAWLALSLSIFGWRWHRVRRSLGDLRASSAADGRLLELVEPLCSTFGMKVPEIRLLDNDRPLAMVHGIIRKTVVVSRGALSLLDKNELKAVLAHELAHLRRQGQALNWLLLFWRDLAAFSPVSLWAFSGFHRAEEQTCDDLAVAGTGLRIELASALVKFMRHAASGVGGGAAGRILPGLFAGPCAAEARVRRLLAADTRAAGRGPAVSPSRGILTAALVLLTALLFIC